MEDPITPPRAFGLPLRIAPGAPPRRNVRRIYLGNFQPRRLDMNVFLVVHPPVPRQPMPALESPRRVSNNQ